MTMLHKSIALRPRLGPLALMIAVLGLSPPAGAQSLYEDALARFKAEDYRGAMIQLKNTLQREPDNLSARILLGRTYVRLGDGEAARKELLYARFMGADEALILEPLASAFLLQRDFQAVLDEITPEKAGRRLLPLVLNIRGQVLLRLHRHEEAEAALRRSDALEPGVVEVRLALARALLGQGKRQEAEATVDQVLRGSPDDAEALRIKGEILAQGARFEEALGYFDRARDAAPEDAGIRKHRAAALFDLGATAEALREVERVLALTPADPQANYLHARILLRLGREDEAQAALDGLNRYLDQVEPEALLDNPETTLLAAMLKAGRGELERASELLGSYLERSPGHLYASKLAAEVFLRQQRAKAAIRVLERARQANGQADGELLGLLARGYMDVGWYSLATETLMDAAALEPDNAGIKTRLGLARLALGATEEARADLATAAEMQWTSLQPKYVWGLTQLQAGNLEEALRLAEELVRRDPGNPIPHNLAGSVLYGMGRLDEARAHFERALSLDEDYIQAQFNLVKLDVQEGRLREADRRLEAILQRDGDNSMARYESAKIDVQRNDRMSAIRKLEQLQTMDPGHVRGQLLLAALYLDTKRWDDATALAESLARDHPNSYDALEMLGNVYQATGRREAATKTYDRLAAMVTGLPEREMAVARQQVKVGDLAGARRTIHRVMKERPNALAPHAIMASIELLEGDVEGARKRAAALQARHPDAPIGYVLAGNTHMATGDFAAAARAFDAALDRAPGDTGLVEQRFRAEERAFDLATAIRNLEAWRGDSDAPELERLLADALLRAGRYGEARSIYEGLLAQGGNDHRLLNNLAWLYHREGDPRAAELAERAYELAPAAVPVLDTLGWILVDDKGDLERGLRLLREAAARDATAPSIRYHLAVALYRQGRDEDALAELETIAARDALDEVAGARELYGKLRRGP